MEDLQEYWFTMIPATFYSKDERMRFILSKHDALSHEIAYVFHRLICESVKRKGTIYGSEYRIATALDFDPEDEESIARLRAILEKLQANDFIKVDYDNQIIQVLDFEDYVGKERATAREAREKRRLEKERNIANDVDEDEIDEAIIAQRAEIAKTKWVED